MPRALFEHGVCMSKVYSAQNITQAANLAWLMAHSLRSRTAAYRCPGCGKFHVSAHRASGPDVVVCSWPT